MILAGILVMMVGGFLLGALLGKLNGRCPEAYSATELKTWPVSEKVEAKDGRSSMWRPARPCGIFGFAHLGRRIRIAWRVLLGTYDAVNWGEASGEAVSTGENYRDILDDARDLERSLAVTRGNLPSNQMNNSTADVKVVGMEDIGPVNDAYLSVWELHLTVAVSTPKAVIEAAGSPAVCRLKGDISALLPYGVTASHVDEFMREMSQGVVQ